MLGWKQEAMADRLGRGWSQKRISLLENKEEIDIEIIRQISEILDVPEELLKNATRSMLKKLLQSTREKLSIKAFNVAESTKSALEFELYTMSKLKEGVNILVDCQRYLATLFDRNGTGINSVDFSSETGENNKQSLEESVGPVQGDHDTEV